jgi:flagellar biosynthetic protein FlhB
MAETQDDAQKTEDPSQRRLQRAREEGRIAQSREINTWFMLGASGIVLIFIAPTSAAALAQTLAAFVQPQRFLSGDDVAWDAVAATLEHALVALALPLALLLAVGVAGSLVQTGFVLATERLGFDPSHLSL